MPAQLIIVDRDAKYAEWLRNHLGVIYSDAVVRVMSPDQFDAARETLTYDECDLVLLTAGFAAIFIQQSDVVSDVSLTYGAWFLGLCFAGHLFLRFTLPHADPYMFPLVAVLACFGLVVIYRIDEELAREQAQWFVVGLGLFALTILLLLWRPQGLAGSKTA